MKRKLLSLILCVAMLLSMLTVCVLPASAETYGSLTYSVTNGEVTITDCDTSASGALDIPAEIDGCPVTGIGYDAFYNCTGLTDITIPDSVTSIGDEAFYNCTRLTDITIPDSVTSIGEFAFSNCTGLESVHITDVAAWCAIDFGYFSSNPFGNAADLYLNDDKVTTLIIPDSVTSIGDRAFSGCTSLTDITIHDSVTSIGWNAFSRCTGLTDITIPDSVTSIGDCAFSGCNSLTGVTIGNGVTTIGWDAFYGCTGLESVHITDVAAWCAINFGNYASNPLYCAGDLYLNGDKVTTLTIPDGVTSIGGRAFYGCTSLTDITIPDSVTQIKESAFFGCTALKTVSISKNLFFVQNSAFENCATLTDVYYSGTALERSYISVSDNNVPLYQATWHYRNTDCTHTYDNACDSSCNICGETRTITHSYGEYVYNNDATYEKDGTKTRTCKVCGNKETVTALDTKLNYMDIKTDFTDIKSGAYYETAVSWAVANNITTGTSATTFSPDNKCTRGQIVTFLWRAAGSPKASTTDTAFTDIKEGSYYYDAVLWAVENGITSGTTATTFSPNSTCTRGQIVTFLWRFWGEEKATVSNPFSDTSSSAYYAEAMLWAVENGITTGTSATTFSPANACTRGQCVTFLYRSFC